MSLFVSRVTSPACNLILHCKISTGSVKYLPQSSSCLFCFEPQSWSARFSSRRNIDTWFVLSCFILPFRFEWPCWDFQKNFIPMVYQQDYAAKNLVRVFWVILSKRSCALLSENSRTIKELPFSCPALKWRYQADFSMLQTYFLSIFGSPRPRFYAKVSGAMSCRGPILGTAP